MTSIIFRGDYLAAVISFSGSLADFTKAEYQDFILVKRFLNLNELDKNKALSEISPASYLDKNDPPFFLTHGSADEVVPVEMTRDFVLELQKRDHPFEYIEVEGGKHSLSSTRPKKASEVFSASMAFFQRYAYE
ncbi:alpha/beta hydrolase family protein [Pseudocolwellia sp. HL-MZ19]|uniref:alpha/beta hydrolase family protein n=1 Tax=Pseudocolwellia sp. HL-MZ19 TaxID=3400846 RepID=UPI003CEDD15E